GRRLLATPSTFIQFKAHCTNFTLDQLTPGWRYLDLLPDGRVETQVHRLTDQRFSPDMESEGY
ncbi:MAG: 3',5'-cyclic-AMP phosphodiesterase, partial [Plesiomonas shigelloides]